MVFLHSTTMLVISGLITGVGQGFLYPTLNALAIRGRPARIRGKINGVFTGGIDAGIMSGSVCLGFIGDLAGFRAVFVAAGLSLLFGLMVFRLQVARRPI